MNGRDREFQQEIDQEQPRQRQQTEFSLVPDTPAYVNPARDAIQQEHKRELAEADQQTQLAVQERSRRAIEATLNRPIVPFQNIATVRQIRQQSVGKGKAKDERSGSLQMKRYLDTEEADYVTFTDRLANALGKIPSSAAAKQLYRAAKALNAEATSVKKLTLSAMLGTTAWSQRSLTYSLGFIRNLYNSGQLRNNIASLTRMGFIVWCGGSVAIQSANAATMFHTIGSAVIAFVINHYSLLTLVTVGILAINKMGDVILETADATLTFARDVATFGIAVSAVTASFSFKGLIMLSGHMYRFIQQSLEYATQERDIQQNLIVCLDEQIRALQILIQGATSLNARDIATKQDANSNSTAESNAETENESWLQQVARWTGAKALEISDGYSQLTNAQRKIVDEFRELLAILELQEQQLKDVSEERANLANMQGLAFQERKVELDEIYKEEEDTRDATNPTVVAKPPKRRTQKTKKLVDSMEKIWDTLRYVKSANIMIKELKKKVVHKTGTNGQRLQHKVQQLLEKSEANKNELIKQTIEGAQARDRMNAEIIELDTAIVEAASEPNRILRFYQIGEDQRESTIENFNQEVIMIGASGHSVSQTVTRTRTRTRAENRAYMDEEEVKNDQEEIMRQMKKDKEKR